MAAAVAFVAAHTSPILAQGGPPLVGDDPETPGSGHWEINLAVMMSHLPGEADWGLPDVDINYGLGEQIQLKFDTPYALAQGGGARSGLGPSLFGAKWRFLGDDQSGFAMSVYPQWTTHLVRSSVDRGLAQPGSEWFVPIEAGTRLGETKMALEVGPRWQSGQQRTWEAGLIAGRGCAHGVECLVEIRETGISNDSKTLLNLGARWKLTSTISLQGALGHEFAPTRAAPRHILLYAGVKLSTP